MESAIATTWEVSIVARKGRPDPARLHAEMELANLAPQMKARWGVVPPTPDVVRGYLLEGNLRREDVLALTRELLVDDVVETFDVVPLGTTPLSPRAVTVLRKPGVMDPPAQSAEQALRALGYSIHRVRAFHRYIFSDGAPADAIDLAARQALANDAVEQVVRGPLSSRHLAQAVEQPFQKITVPLLDLDDAGLERLSKEGQLYLNLAEMKTIQASFRKLGRPPTDIELETLAQTWSEHCSHKTFRSPYALDGGPQGENLLKETIMRATRSLGRDWCVSVFEDNAGVIKFDDDWNVCFKVETHNHPSAIEPYGGANTGVGGCVRDPMGTGLGAKPIANTDVFCVAPPELEQPPPAGVLHPARVLRGVVAGVRDYGNRMGIPTVNGAVCFDERYLGNPLVFCGTVGLLPADKSFGKARAGDLIVALGGRTGRDGIHGATFSSGELTSESERLAGGAVQIGNAIMEKKVLDVLLAARDRELFHAVTDCGAGGFSSAVGEMGAEIGARVLLENAPLKYQGLTYTEIWISEAQERMVLAVSPDRWPALRDLAASEDVEAVILGTFEPTGKLTLTYRDHLVGELSMEFLHGGRPRIVRRGIVAEPSTTSFAIPPGSDLDPGRLLHRLLASLDVCSKEWIIRQYDHEVQGASVIKPLVGAFEDGPSDAAVLTPLLGGQRGLALGCGINPRLGDLDPYQMAAHSIDEAMRNVVAVGADPQRTALLDNFCWGNTDRPEVFGSLCQAAFACRDIAIALGAPFISGKDSLNNEFKGDGKHIVIPPTLLISAMGIVPDVRKVVTMDLKQPGNQLLIVGATGAELAGSQLARLLHATGGRVPVVDPARAKQTFDALHRAITQGLVRSCHDCSEGGLAVALAEMAFAGDLGARIDLERFFAENKVEEWAGLFSESPSRFVLEVEPGEVETLMSLFDGIPIWEIGEVVVDKSLTLRVGERPLLSEPIDALRATWKRPLAW